LTGFSHMPRRLLILTCDSVIADARAAAAGLERGDVEIAAAIKCAERGDAQRDRLRSLVSHPDDPDLDVRVLAGRCFPSEDDAGAGATAPTTGGPVCGQDLVAPWPLIEHLASTGAYVITSGWLLTWRERIAEWGFGSTEAARAFVQDSASRLALLDTGVAPHADRLLAELADHLDLPAERIPVGLDYCRARIEREVLAWSVECERASALSAGAAANHRAADYAMVLDLLGRVAGLTDEEHVADQVHTVLALLFCPERALVASVHDDGGIRAWSCPAEDGDVERARVLLETTLKDRSWAETEHGFAVRLEHGREVLGLIDVDGVAFPQYRDRYVSIARMAAGACALALGTSRAYGKLQQAVSQLEVALADRERQAGLLLEAHRHIQREHDRMRHELDLAAQVQQHLVPRRCFAVGVDMGHCFIPSGKVGGDLLGIARADDGRSLAYLGDVSGHGVASALVMTLITGVLGEVAWPLQSPAEAMRAMQERLGAQLEDLNHYATLCLLTFDPALGVATVCSAGHPSPLVVSSAGTRELVAEPATPLGFPGPADYGDLVIELSQGDTLLLYSDGLTEARNGVGERIGRERLLQWCDGAVGRPPSGLLDSIDGPFREWVEGTPLDDDVTMLALQRLTLVDDFSLAYGADAADRVAERMLMALPELPAETADHVRHAIADVASANRPGGDKRGGSDQGALRGRVWSGRGTVQVTVGPEQTAGQAVPRRPAATVVGYSGPRQGGAECVREGAVLYVQCWL